MKYNFVSGGFANPYEPLLRATNGNSALATALKASSKRSMQEFQNNLAVKADERAQYAAEAKGYNQGDKVSTAMSGITGIDSGTNALDNKKLMGALNTAYDQTEDKKLTQYVAKLDDLGLGDEDADMALSDAELADYKARLGKAEALTNKLNKAVQSGVTNKELYKTDATTAKGAILKQMLDNGVNPVYAETMASKYAGEYTQAKPTLTDYQKAILEGKKEENKLLAKQTVKVANKTGGASSTASGKTKAYDMTKQGDTLAVKANVIKKLNAVAEDGKLDNYWFATDGELRDVKGVIDALQEPIELGGKKYYLNETDVSNFFNGKLKDDNFMVGTTLIDGASDTDKAIKYAKLKLRERLANGTIKSGGTGSKSSTTTTTSINSEAAKKLGKNTQVINTITEALRPKTGAEQLQALIGNLGQYRYEDGAKGNNTISKSNNSKKVKPIINAAKNKEVRAEQLKIDAKRNEEEEAIATKKMLERITHSRNKADKYSKGTTLQQVLLGKDYITKQNRSKSKALQNYIANVSNDVAAYNPEVNTGSKNVATSMRDSYDVLNYMRSLGYTDEQLSNIAKDTQIPLNIRSVIGNKLNR